MIPATCNAAGKTVAVFLHRMAMPCDWSVWSRMLWGGGPLPAAAGRCSGGTHLSSLCIRAWTNTRHVRGWT